MAISNKDTLRLKELIVCGRTNTVYHPRVYPPRTFHPYLIEENPDKFEVVESSSNEVVPSSTIIEKTAGVEIKAINNVMVTPKEELPVAEKIELSAPVEKVKTKLRRNRVEE